MGGLVLPSLHKGWVNNKEKEILMDIKVDGFYSFEGRNLKVRKIKGESVTGIWLDNREPCKVEIAKLEEYQSQPVFEDIYRYADKGG